MESIKSADLLKSENKQLKALILMLRHQQRNYLNVDFDTKLVENNVFKDILDDFFINKHTCDDTKKLTTQQWIEILETTLYSQTKK